MPKKQITNEIKYKALRDYYIKLFIYNHLSFKKLIKLVLIIDNVPNR